VIYLIMSLFVNEEFYHLSQPAGAVVAAASSQNSDVMC
jgi:hypothetical protein